MKNQGSYLHKDFFDNRKLIKCLESVKGIGKYNAKQICNLLGLSYALKGSELSYDEFVLIKKILQENYLIGSSLDLKIKQGINTEIEISSYKGMRHRFGLPVRGQRTHTNAKTQKRLFPSRLI